MLSIYQYFLYILSEYYFLMISIKSNFHGFNLDLTIPSNEPAIHKLYKAIHQILLLRLNHTEIACLKTLILFRPGKCWCFVFMKTYKIQWAEF